jgi:uncharacterized protein involved in exopolysaccharide biosynthesis
MSKIDKEELEEINNLRNEIAGIVSETGQTTLQIELLESDIQELKQQVRKQVLQFKQLLGKEQELLNRLSEKYGVGSINFETGEFTAEK